MRGKLLCLLFGLSMTFMLHAQPLLSGVLELQPLQGAQVLEQVQYPAVEKIYPLGTIQRISGRLRFADEVLVRGQRDVLTVQLANTYTAAEAFHTVQEQLFDSGMRLVFWCEGKDCGPSNLWANTVFSNSRLYGPDDRQRYVVFVDENSNALAALYATTRGNGRGMLHAELFMADELPQGLKPTPATLVRQLRTGAPLSLAHLSKMADEEWVTLLARTLSNDRSIRVVLGGKEAQTWAQAIVKKGVASNRIEVEDNEELELYMQVIR